MKEYDLYRIQYDLYRNTREVLKAVRTEHTQRLQNELTLQGATFSFLTDNSLKMANSLWSSVQSCMPPNIFNFTVRYLIIHWQRVETLLDRILVKVPIAPSAFDLTVCYILLQGAKLTLMRGVLYGVTAQHCYLLQTLVNPLLVLPYTLIFQAFFLHA